MPTQKWVKVIDPERVYIPSGFNKSEDFRFIKKADCSCCWVIGDKDGRETWHAEKAYLSEPFEKEELKQKTSFKVGQKVQALKGGKIL